MLNAIWKSQLEILHKPDIYIIYQAIRNVLNAEVQHQVSLAVSFHITYCVISII